MSTLSRTIQVEGFVGEIQGEPTVFVEAEPGTDEYEPEPAQIKVTVELTIIGTDGVEALRKMQGMMFTMIND